MNSQKQTQSKPILVPSAAEGSRSFMAGKIALSEACGERSRTVEGPMEPILQGGKPLKILKILPVQHLTNKRNRLKYRFSYGYGNLYEELSG